MKKQSLGWIVAGIVTVLGCTMGAMQQQSAVGRWQVVVGPWVNHRDGKTGSVAVLVDTTTGDTYWRSSGDIPWNLVLHPQPR